MEVLGAVLFLILTTAGLITAVPRFFDGNGDDSNSVSRFANLGLHYG